MSSNLVKGSSRTSTHIPNGSGVWIKGWFQSLLFTRGDHKSNSFLVKTNKMDVYNDISNIVYKVRSKYSKCSTDELFDLYAELKEELDQYEREVTDLERKLPETRKACLQFEKETAVLIYKNQIDSLSYDEVVGKSLKQVETASVEITVLKKTSMIATLKEEIKKMEEEIQKKTKLIHEITVTRHMLNLHNGLWPTDNPKRFQYDEEEEDSTKVAEEK